MKIHIDIVHMADINFYKNAINILEKKGHEILITCRDRGRIKQVIEKELGKKPVVIGKHYNSKLTKIVGIFERTFRLFFYQLFNRPNVCTGFGSFYIGISGKLLFIPSVLFYDDKEYKLNYNLCRKFSTRFVIPNSIKDENKNIIKGFDFKELAYLDKNYFKPNKNILKQYNLKPDDYIFIRDVMSSSLNYSDLKTNLDVIIKQLKDKGEKIVLSLEDKTKKVDSDCIILKEPVEDFYSLLYYSKFVISSGDTVAREAALLGIPTFFTGKRKMKVNQELEKSGILIKMNDLKELTKKVKKVKMKKYSDTTKSIIKHLESFK